MSTEQDRNARYDRQIRLWGEEGQNFLEKAKICLINANAVGSETLKNLVLPGIGSVTIIDHHSVIASDVGCNFFVSESTIGQPRAKVVTEYLQEMNEFVEFHYENIDPVHKIETDPAFFTQFSLVITSDLAKAPMLDLSEILWENKIPLVVLRACGLIGGFRIAVPEHVVIDAKPDIPPEDLRIAQPFPELQAIVDAIDFDKLNSQQHAHIPYVLLLIKALDAWKRMQGQQGVGVPSNGEERKAFKEVVSGMRQSIDEENFDEAMQYAYKSWQVPSIPSSVQRILDDDCVKHLSSESSVVWIMIAGLAEFVKKEGCGTLPLQGGVPDMTADTETYINLQRVYREHAEHDVDSVFAHIRVLLETLGKQTNAVSRDQVRQLCKNASLLHVARYPKLADDYHSGYNGVDGGLSSGSASTMLGIGEMLRSIEFDDNPVWAILLIVLDFFKAKYGRLPSGCDDIDISTPTTSSGDGDGDVNMASEKSQLPISVSESSIANKDYEADIPLLRECTAEYLEDIGIKAKIPDEYIHEMCRYGGGEIHSVAAAVGGVAAQEIIKLVVGQQIPLKSTFVFNGVKASTSVL